MTKPVSFGTIKKIPHPNITSGHLVSKSNFSLTRDELCKCLHGLDRLMGEQSLELGTKVEQSNGYTLLISPTVIEDHRHFFGQQEEEDPELNAFNPSFYRERLGIVLNNGDTYLIIFNEDHIHRVFSADMYGYSPWQGWGQGPHGRPHPPIFGGGYQGPGPFGKPGLQQQSSWSPQQQQMEFIIKLLKFPTVEETVADDNKGFAK